MKTDLHLKSVTELNSLSVDFETQNVVSHESLVYNEMSDFPVRGRTEIESLQENLLVLKDMSDRLAFLSKEIKYLLNLK